MTSDDEQAIQAAWDRVGRYMQGMGSVGQRMVQRNLTLWTDVAASLSSGPVDANKLAGSAARAIVAAQETAEDLWTSLAEPPQSQTYVQVLPTAFLFFRHVSSEGSHVTSERTNDYTLLDPVHIPVTLDRHRDLPDRARIALNGTRFPIAPAGPTRADSGSGKPQESDGSAATAADAIVQRLHATLEAGRRSYLLETVTQGSPPLLVPGVYDGLVYLPNPPLPLANLRVIVDAPPEVG
ncbi:MAG: hypothetical protein L0H26_06675 [Microlunatus sp.]|nr:hypothetical protein [Microlunatus sp.]